MPWIHAFVKHNVHAKEISTIKSQKKDQTLAMQVDDQTFKHVDASQKIKNFFFSFAVHVKARCVYCLDSHRGAHMELVSEKHQKKSCIK